MSDETEDTGKVLLSMDDVAGHKMHLFAMHGEEALGGTADGLFEYRLEIASHDPEIDPNEILGQNVNIRLALEDGGERVFNGYVGQFGPVGQFVDHTIYHATVRPWLCFLGFTTDCRIFPKMSVPDIVKLIFRKHREAEFADSLLEKYATRDHTVQYNESDLHFVTRLLQEEGIYYFFEHEEGKHTLVLADAPSAHKPVTGYEKIPFWTVEAGHDNSNYFDGWKLLRGIKTGVFATKDFDFEHVTADLLATRNADPTEKRYSVGQIFEFPSGLLDRKKAESRADMRLHELLDAGQELELVGNTRALGVGSVVKVTNLPASLNPAEFLLTSAQYQIHGAKPWSGGGSGDESMFRVTYNVIGAKTQYRPPRTAQKPAILGAQTAIVVGSKKTLETDPEEIETDPYGRVKVRFHWERIGKQHPAIRGEINKVVPSTEEDNTCWVRVAQMWAGAKWGAIHIPRIGQEVVVTFLDGDPDRPLIIGSVYNADNMPPYDLPQHKTQSGIKSRSTKKGTQENFNEIRFEDEKGKEELHIQAELDMSTNVKRNQTLYVGGDQSITIHGNQTISVHGTDEKTGKKLPVQSVTSVTGKHTFDASDTIKIQAPTSVTLECGGSTIVVEPGKITMKAGDGATMVLDANAFTKASGGGQILVDANVKAESAGGGQMVLDANVKAQSAGGSKMQLDSNAAMEGTANASVKGAVEATLAGAAGNVKADLAGVAISGPKVDVSGQSLVSINGTMVKLN